VKHVLDWLHDRLGLGPILAFVRGHKVPPELAGRRGWMYVFGFATLAAFLSQVVTGVALATMYVPAPAHAHDSLVHITEGTRFGGVLRGMHYFGASAMVLLVLVHMARVYLTGSYKAPRQMNWITGVLLLVLVLTMALTGQLLRWDENGMWTVIVAAKFAEHTPLVGPWIAEFFLGGTDIGGTTLTRAHALHVVVLPAGIFAFVGVHMYLLVHNGISEPPNAEAPTDPKRYRAWYEARKKAKGVPYLPFAMWREVVVACLVVLVIVALAWIVGPKGPAGPADPTDMSAAPKPDWFVRWYYALLFFKPRGLETFVMVYLPILALLGLLGLPLVFGGGRRAIKHRPWAPIIVASGVVAFGVLTVTGMNSDWTPAYDVTRLSDEEVGVAAGPVHEGARLFHEKGCMYCHKVGDRGGQYGPDLSDAAHRLSREEMTVRIVQGYRDMPAYRDALTAEELEPLVAFLFALPERAR
jgi:ubiquinol-cytochrome c reductase cytochrome b subunit